MNGKVKDNEQLFTTKLENFSLSALPQLPQDQLDSLASKTFFSNRHAHKQKAPSLGHLLSLIDIVLASSPLLFLGLAVAAIFFDGKPQNNQNQLSTFDPSTGQYVRSQAAGTQGLLVPNGGDAVIAAAEIAVSVFPIIFAAIVGRFLKSYAMHRAEKGTPMGILEQIVGSQNLPNAVQLTCALGGPGLLGVGVVFLWLLSPLGGQATQRVLDKKTVFNGSTGNIFYTNTSAMNGVFADPFASVGSTDNIYATLSAAMLSDRTTTSHDIWGNVRIPNIEKLDMEGHDISAIANGSSALYTPPGSPSSSMVGLLINNVTTTTFTSFTVRTSYMNLTCDEPRTWNYSFTSNATSDLAQSLQQQLQPYYDFLTWADLVTKLANDTDTDSKSSSSTTEHNQFWATWSFNIGVQTNGTSNMTGDPVRTFAYPPTFVYAAQDNYNNIITAYKCASRVVWVESDVVCDTTALCTIHHIRNSTQPEAAMSDQIFDQSNDNNGHGSSLNRMLAYLNRYSTPGRQGVVNPIQWYLSGSSNVFPSEGGTPDYTQVSGDQMASKLASLLNTFWMIGLQRESVSQPRITNATRLLASENNSTTYGTYPALGYDVTGAYARLSQPNDIYNVNWPFAIIVIVISLMLVLLGFLGIYYRRTNTHPDILGYVSTLARDNPNFAAPLDAHKADGLELANYYKSLRVQLVNTTVDDDRGRIILVPLYGGA